jgi:hypothetical protein
MNNVTKILIIAGVSGVGYAIYRYFKPKKTKEYFKEQEQLNTGGGKAGAGGGTTTPTQTYANAMYSMFAEQIWDAAHANNFTGTQEDEIYDVFASMKSDIDISKLISAFGKRRMYLTFSDAPLKQWIQAEMDSKEIAKINSILQSNKIAYRF